MLLGVTMAVYQVGSFLGTWLGGVAVERTGSCDAVWMLDLVLAAIAALLHVPVREGREQPDLPLGAVATR